MEVRIHLPKQVDGKRFTDASLLIESPLVDNIRLPLSDYEANSPSIDKIFEVGWFWRQKDIDFNVTFNSANLSGVSGAMAVIVEPQWG